MASLVVVGSTNIDLTFRVRRLPRPGETVSGHGLSQDFGGKGANQAVMAACLGARVTMLSAVGDDASGRQAIDNYRAMGVDTAFVRIVDEPTGTAAIVVDDAANNAIIVVAGANARLGVDDVRAAAAVIAKADVVVAQCETPIDATLEAFRLARAARVRTILNPAPACELPDALLALTDLIVPNETELEALTGLPAGSEAEVTHAAIGLRERGPARVLVTLGERGALLLEGSEACRIPTPRVEAVDPTAAGDAFIGALAVFLASGGEMKDAASKACRVAARTVTRLGAQRSFPTRAEIEAEGN